MVSEKLKTASAELWFTIGVLLLGLSFLWSIQYAQIDDTGVNSHTLPSFMAGSLVLYALFRLLQLIRNPEPPHTSSDAVTGAQAIGSLFFKVVVPLVLEMIAYVQLIQLIGYMLATFVVMLAVFWSFGLRKLLPMLALSALAAVSADFLFIKLLSMYVPDGSLISGVGF